MVVLFGVTLNNKKFGQIWHRVKWGLFLKHENILFSFCWNTYSDKKKATMCILITISILNI